MSVDAAVAREPNPRSAERGDDWPHTTRLMPWLLAGFMAMVFLLPIDSTELRVHLPFDSKPDRVAIAAMLAVLAITALLPRSEERRSRRATPFVKAAVLIYGALVLLSVLVNVDRIYLLGQLTFAEKALSQVLAYLGFFFIVATQVRSAEVSAYGRLIVGLSVVTALGTLLEARTGYNVFYQLGGDLLRPIAAVAPAPTKVGAAAVGRPTIVGPTKHGLALASMLSIALPFAVLRMQQARTWGNRLGWLLIICLLLAAALATGRKTAIVAPIAAFAVLIAYNRRMLRWAPVAVVAMIPAIHFISPGALGTFDILASASSSDSTTQRISDYSGIAPDVLSHPIIGQGYGSLDTDNPRWYRILDNEYLDELFQGGLLGVLAYLLMVIAPLITAHRLIRRSDGRGPPIVAAAAGCAAYAVVSATFDAMGFPQAPYSFFFVAGLIAAVAGAPDDDRPRAPVRRAASPPPRPRQLRPDGALVAVRGRDPGGLVVAGRWGRPRRPVGRRP